MSRQSRERWGAGQAFSYVSGLTASLSRLTQMPELGVGRSDLGSGYRSLGVGAHAIFCRVEHDRIEVIRILRQRMDTGTHLS
ncbi:type II toxin-antitoxin system RelE/ParE family toxin [Bosea sp. OAE506]|uniref:type II toxin-antitoxin system RelE/ParE family toxin n=1 Tax=Bosea sp. OAE506 TaxID=2663870 RepID=UPI00178B2E46